MKILTYIFIALLILQGCRPAKKVQKIEDAISKKDTSDMVRVRPEMEVIDSFSIVKNIINNLNSQRVDYKTFTAKMKVDYQGKDAGDQATANIRMKKDSLIWISLTGALGIEGFRLMINQDSLKLMNKLDKTIQYRSIEYLQELTDIPLDFFGLQDLILGNPVFLDSNIVSYKAGENQLLILMVGRVFKNLITLKNYNLRMLHSKLDDVNPMRNRTCDITYGGYSELKGFNFSAERRITVSENSKLDIDIVFKQFTFNQPVTFPFSIPKNYKRK